MAPNAGVTGTPPPPKPKVTADGVEEEKEEEDKDANNDDEEEGAEEDVDVESVDARPPGRRCWKPRTNFSSRVNKSDVGTSSKSISSRINRDTPVQNDP